MTSPLLFLHKFSIQLTNTLFCNIVLLLHTQTLYIGNTHRPKHSTHQQRQDQRQLTLQKSNYLSATRQLENSICTNRESLIGSGAWNKEFYGELQSRPFYSSGPTLLCHDSRGGFGEFWFLSYDFTIFGIVCCDADAVQSDWCMI